MSRAERVAKLIGAARAGYDAHVTDPKARTSTTVIFDALSGPLEIDDVPGEQLPVCDLIETVAGAERMPDAPLRDLAAALRDIMPDLRWYKRVDDPPVEDETYQAGHANAMIVGPRGLVPHKDIWLGLSLLAPHVRYPDHDHPPEETYLVLSEGEFFQEGRSWFRPGIGGSFYNRPGILHAMRSGDTPLFAMWALRAA